MANIVEIVAGGHTKDDSFPPSDVNSGVSFANDGILHRCGWMFYVPPSLQSVTPLYLRLFFMDSVGVAGTAQVVLRWAYGTDAGTLATLPSPDTLAIPFTGVALQIPYVDVLLSTRVVAGATALGFTMERDSSEAADTFATSLVFLNGYSIQG